MDTRIIHIRVDAPVKPQLGQPCNGCGLCCAAEPCPIGMVVSGRRRGACAALRWDSAQSRYLCGLLAHAQGSGRLRRGLVSRWIAAGVGCDSLLEPASNGL